MLKIQSISKQSGEWDTRLKNKFKKLKTRILLQVITTSLISLLIGGILLNVFVDGILQDPFAKIFISFAQNILNVPENTAYQMYWGIFQGKKYLWLILGYTLILIIIFYRSLLRLIKYFNEVNNGLDRLLEENDTEVMLSPEIETIEKKLNKIKSTLKKRELDAQNAEQRKNDLVVYLAHDIKTPLTSVIGYLSLLEEAPDMPIEQRAKYLKITLDKAFRLEQLINEFFEITRYNLQTILLDKQEINLSYMLLQMADEFYPQLSASGKTAVVDTEDNLIIIADPDKLARVFNNIMKNALAYSYENSAIHITAKLLGTNVQISFHNQGNTIPEHKLETIFDKFYRLDDARSSVTGGSGLGLAIAKSIITSHGGSIRADSRDGHTTFTVLLPAVST